MGGARLVHALAAAALLAAAACGGEASDTAAPTAAAPASQAPPAALERRALSADGPLPDGVGAIDLAARLAKLEREHPEATDRSETFFGEGSTVHVHLMGREQMTPLHVHRAEEEAVVIVSGEARVTQLFGRDGALARRAGVHGPGELIQSPPLCGHEFANTSLEGGLGTLVFSLPRFHGNLYLRPEDPRLLQGSEPFVYDTGEELRAFAAGSDEERRTTLPIMSGAMSVLLLKKKAVLEPGPGGPFVGYVLAGTARLEGYDEVGPRHLLLFNSSSPVVIRARRRDPLALLLFDPHAATAAARAGG